MYLDCLSFWLSLVVAFQHIPTYPGIRALPRHRSTRLASDLFPSGDAIRQPTLHVITTNNDTPAGKALTNVYRRGKPICGPLSEEQSEALFATRSNDVPALASAAMIPLGTSGVHGALVLASRKGERFVPDMGTLFLELMGELVTVALQRLLGRETLP